MLVRPVVVLGGQRAGSAGSRAGRRVMLCFVVLCFVVLCRVVSKHVLYYLHFGKDIGGAEGSWVQSGAMSRGERGFC